MLHRLQTPRFAGFPFMSGPQNSAEPSPRVLIADADSATRALYASSCLAEGWDVVEAATGRDALVRALMRPPSIAVLDLHLPLIDGVALCEIFRKDRATVSVPIIALTDTANHDEDKRALRAGADAVLTKPTRPETLIAEAHRLVSWSRDLRQRAEVGSSEAAELCGRAQALIGEGRTMPSGLRRQQIATTTPPISPPRLHCLECEALLKYERSYIGGVSHRHWEQWDYYTCQRCGRFQYRHRTRKLRRV